jgi:hypothetical protein
VADIHIPKLGEHGGGKSIVKVALEVILISVGVFLGLAGEQWRENARHRELAEDALRRFRTEIVANHKSIAAVQDYHLARREELHAAIEAAAQNREPNSIHLSGIQPASLEHTAWELALRQPSLAYIDTNLAYSLSQIYQAQERLDALGRGLSQAMYVNPPAVKPKEFRGRVCLLRRRLDHGAAAGDHVRRDPATARQGARRNAGAEEALRLDTHPSSVVEGFQGTMWKPVGAMGTGIDAGG